MTRRTTKSHQHCVTNVSINSNYNDNNNESSNGGNSCNSNSNNCEQMFHTSICRNFVQRPVARITNQLLAGPRLSLFSAESRTLICRNFVKRPKVFGRLVERPNAIHITYPEDLSPLGFPTKFNRRVTLPELKCPLQLYFSDRK